MLTVNTTCLPSGGGTDCEAIPPPERECVGRPTQMTMLYNGGPCTQSATPQRSQPSMFYCQDIGDGPPSFVGAKSYIVVTAVSDPSTVYYQGFVAVGDTYILENNGNRFVADQNITIYSSDQVGPESMLQTLFYTSSCAQTVYLKDRYGASQLVEWVNDEQGQVTSYANVSFTITVSVPMEDEVHSVRLKTLSSSTSFGTFNLTEQVYGTVVASGESVATTIVARIDLTVNRRNTLLTTATGQRSGAMECRGIDFYAFIAGTSAQTIVPTQSPTVTAAPTPDPDSTPCIVAAEVRCVIANSNRPCSDLTPPTASRCVGDSPSELRFLYNPGPCSQSNTTSNEFNCVDERDDVTAQLRAYIRVTDQDRTVSYFEGPVKRGEIFVVGNGIVMAERLFLEVFVDSGSGPGDRIQSLALHTICDDQSDISLLTNYGSLQLTAFDNEQLGFQSAVDAIEQTFVIRNDGMLVARVEWTNVTSTLYGESALISPPGLQIPPGLEYPFAYEGTQINLYASTGQTYKNVLRVSGVGLTSGLACDAVASVNFTISEDSAER